MSQLRIRLTANRARLTFPPALALLRELVADLVAVEPDWLTVAEAVEAAEPGGRHPPNFFWAPEASLRPDDGPAQDHLLRTLTFAAGCSGWLLQMPLPGDAGGFGRHAKGLVLVSTSQFLRLLPPLFTARAPAVWARNWPSLSDVAIDIDRLDPCCDGAAGYLVELYRGRHQADHRG